MVCDGCNPPQHAGRSGLPNIRQRNASSNCTHRTPAGLPPGMPGIGLEIEGEMQQAPHPLRQTGAAEGFIAVFGDRIEFS